VAAVIIHRGPLAVTGLPKDIMVIPNGGFIKLIGFHILGLFNDIPMKGIDRLHLY
jgi:hypothetical protein